MHRNLLLSLKSIFIILLMSACAAGIPVQGTFVWIDVPIDGLTIPLNQPVVVEGHAASVEGVAQVEIWIDGSLTFTVEAVAAGGELSYFTQSWTPPGEGHYTIQALAIGASGTSSQADSVRVFVGEVITPTPVTPSSQADDPTATPTEVVQEEMLLPTVELWVEPEEIPAGECAILRWRVENAQSVRLGSSEVPPEGHYEACHCKNELYRLTVTHFDGSEEEHQAIIQVSGSCDAAEPPPDEGEDPPPPSGPDTTPPPAPGQSSPPNGSDIGCVSSANLSWGAVSDPSGIAEYRVEVERHSGDNNWQAAPGSPQTGLSATALAISVECGWTYRWRVQAVDGAGNAGAWSGWFHFNVPLI